MKIGIVHSDGMVLLVGGGSCDKAGFETLLATSKQVVAADSGADQVLEFGHIPDAVIGDLDSLSQDGRAKIPPERVHYIAEQDSTDFDKALRNIDAPLVVGMGFLGRRVDHELAALNVLTRHAHRRCLLVGQKDVILHVPPKIDLDLPIGARLSLFPMSPVSGRSDGLCWPIDGIAMTPGGRTGTSNKVDGPVRLQMDGPGMLLILSRAALDAAQSGLLRAETWPAPDA